MSDMTTRSDLTERRRFLRWLSAVGAGIVGVVIAAPAALAFLSPAYRKPVAKKWVKVADDVNALDVGKPIKIDFVEEANDAWVASRALRTVWLYTEDGEKFTAYSGVCTHLGCAYTFDTVPDSYHSGRDVFHCPCHHGIFDLKTGAVLGGPPPRALDTLPVRVENGEVQVQYRTFRTGIAEKVET